MAKWKIAKPLDAKGCPVCKSGNVFLWTDTGTSEFFMECDDCGADGRTDSAFGAVKRWNRAEVDPER